MSCPECSRSTGKERGRTAVARCLLARGGGAEEARQGGAPARAERSSSVVLVGLGGGFKYA